MTNLILIILLALANVLGGTGLAEKEVAKAVKEGLGDKVKSVEVKIDTDPVTFVNINALKDKCYRPLGNYGCLGSL
jgi:hypothetical protein